MSTVGLVESEKFRAMLFQLSQQLSKDESKALVDIGSLPRLLLDEAPFMVLMQLIMNGRIRRCKDVEEIFENINRFDLAKRVANFARKNRTQKDVADRSTQLRPKLESNSGVVMLQHKILLDQIEQWRENAEKAGYRQVETIVASAKSLAEELKEELDRAAQAQLIALENNSEGSPSPESSLSSSSLSEVMTPVAVSESQLQAAFRNLKRNTSPPRQSKDDPKISGTPKTPLLPPTSRSQQQQPGVVTDERIYCEPNTVRPPLPTPNESEQLEYSYAEVGQTIVPASTQMVTEVKRMIANGKPTPPTPPPKPRASQLTVNSVATVVSAQSRLQAEIDDDDDDYTNTTTGDSGFSDATQFLKISPQQQQQSNTYAALNSHAMNEAPQYMTRSEQQYVQEMTYSEVPTPGLGYLNLPTGGQNRAKKD